MLCHFGAGKVTTCASQCPLTPVAEPNRAPKVLWGRRRARGRIGPFPSTRHAQPHPKPPPGERGSCAGITPARLALSCFLPENPPARLRFQRFPTQGSALNPVPLRLGGGAGTLLQSRAVPGATVALTDFCPFKSLLAFFSPFPTHPWSIAGASRHPPLPLPWQPPPQHPLQQLPPLKFPLKASAGGDCGVPYQEGAWPPTKRVSPRCGEPAVPDTRPRTGSLPAPGKWVIPGACGKLGRGGKGAKRNNVPAVSPEGMVPCAGATAGDADVAPAPG